MMTPVLLILAVFFHINGISCDGEVSTYPETKQFCDKDAFVSSKPIDGKVFLFPAKAAERQGDWYENSLYCANNCAEMVTIHSAAQNNQLVTFVRTNGAGTGGVWLGATIMNKQPVVNWYNGQPLDYTHTIAPGEYNEDGLTALLTGFDASGTSFWGNWYLNIKTVYIACQRPENWTACE